MRFNELYNQKILKFISENRCDLSNLSLQKINSNIYSNIYSFTNLIELNLSENQIYHISSQIENLLNLKTLNLSDNLIEELPSNIGNITELENLFLSGNRLKDLPKTIINLKKLKWLSLLDNKELLISEDQKNWIEELKNNGCIVLI
jgi:Leucine-rich repeat (LRR) protein